MFLLYNIVSDILYYVVVCVDFLGTHMASLVLFLKQFLHVLHERFQEHIYIIA